MGNLFIVLGIIIIVCLVIIAFITVKRNPPTTFICVVGIVLIFSVMVFNYNPSMKKMEVDLKETKAKMERFESEFKSIDQLIKELLGEIKSKNERSGRGYSLPPSLPKGEGDMHLFNIR